MHVDRPRLRLRGIADPLADGTAATPGIVPRAAARVLEVDPTLTICDGSLGVDNQTRIC